MIALSVRTQTDRLAELRQVWRMMGNRRSLQRASDELGRASLAVAELDPSLRELRNRGYVYGRDLETTLRELEVLWPEERDEARRVLGHHASTLQEQVRSLDLDLKPRVDETWDTDNVASLETRVDQAIHRIEEAEDEIRAVYVASDVAAVRLAERLKAAHFLADALEDTTLTLQQAEEPVAACPARWINGEESSRGILFATNQRLVFEQRDVLTLKKRIFRSDAAGYVQMLLWSIPAEALVDAEAHGEDPRFSVGLKDRLTLHLAEKVAALSDRVTLDLEGADASPWARMAHRIHSGEIVAERCNRAPAASRPAPTRCAACGEDLPRVLKGMQAVACMTCGALAEV